MLGLAVLAAYALYIGLSVVLVAYAVRWARRRGIAGWKAGWVVGVAMYLLVFWDLVPTLVVYEYACATKTGFWVYRSVAEWRAMHRDELRIAIAVPGSRFVSEDGSHGYWLDSRFKSVYREQRYEPLYVALFTETVEDGESGEVLAALTRVATVAPREHLFTYFKMWRSLAGCGPPRTGLNDVERELTDFGSAAK